MATVKGKRKTERRQAATEKAILSRAEAATKTPAPKSQKRPSVAPVVDSQEIAGLRAEVERLTAEKADLGATVERLQADLVKVNDRLGQAAWWLVSFLSSFAQAADNDLPLWVEKNPETWRQAADSWRPHAREGAWSE